MIQRASYLVLGLAILLLPISAHALQPPHDDSNSIGCDACHAMHSAGGMMGMTLIPRGEAQEQNCVTCHNPTGQASSMSEVGNHVVKGGTVIVDCGSCHDPHSPHTTTDAHTGGQTAPNLKLVRGDPKKYTTAALDTAIFQQRPEHFSFDTAPYNGICQTCHSAPETIHHRNDGFDPDHQKGLTCTFCHPHDEGFEAVGGCTTCHSFPQDDGNEVPPGGRRQIVGAGGDFEKASHHGSGTIGDGVCAACHYVGDHQSGTVKLKDPDLGSTISYDPATPAGLETFCTNCHDADGAQQLTSPMQPFGDGQTVPNVKGVAGSTWAASAHKTRGYSFNGNSPVTCYGNGTTTGCHSNAHGSDNVKLLSAASGVTIDTFCYRCHTDGKITNNAVSGSSLADDIEQSFNITGGTKHDQGTGFTVGANNYTLQCTTCHNSHVATGKYWEADSGVSPITRPDFSDPVKNPRAMGTTLWGAISGQKMDDYAGSTGKYQKPSGSTHVYTGSQLPDYVNFCLDCHSNAIGSIGAKDWVNDPHGKKVAGYSGLGINYSTAWGPYQCPNGYNICGRATGWSGDVCNSTQEICWPVIPSGRGYVALVKGGYDQADRNAGDNFVLSCTDCHEAHGSDKYSLMRKSLNAKYDGTEFMLSSNQNDWHGLWQGGNPEGLCWSCHGGYQLTKEHFQWHNQTGYCSACNAAHHPNHLSSGMGAFECRGACHTTEYGWGGGMSTYSTSWYNPATFHKNRKALNASSSADSANKSPDLVVDYRFEGNLKDSHMWNMHGLWLNGSGSYVSGKVGNAIQISDNPIEVGAENAPWDSTNEGYTGNTSKITEMKYNMTLEAWVYPTSDPADGYERKIMAKSNYWEGGYALMLRAVSGAYRVGLITNMDLGGPDTSVWDSEGCNGLSGAYSSVTIPLNQWTHVGATFDTNGPDGTSSDLSVGRIRIYVNGEDVTTSNTYTSTECWAQPQAGDDYMTPYSDMKFKNVADCYNGSWCATALSVGGLNWSAPDDSFIGRLDEVKVWNVTKDAAYFDASVPPEITNVEGAIGSNYLFVTFSEGVYTDPSGGALTAADFQLIDSSGTGTQSITGVTHTAGSTQAVITLSSDLTADDLANYTVAAADGSSIYEDQGTAMGTDDEAITASGCPAGGTIFELNEAAASATAYDETGLLYGPVNNPAVVFPGDGLFHGDEAEETAIDITSNDTCMKAPDEFTLEARVYMTDVDLDYVDLRGATVDDPPNGLDDDYDASGCATAPDTCDINSTNGDGRNSTFQRLAERKRTFQFTIFRASYAGDYVESRAGKARVILKYFVDTPSRHDCPHSQWPEDDYVGADSRWHQISSDIDTYPLVQGHWYQIKIVFKSDKSEIAGSNLQPVDIFIDDQGTDGVAEPNPGAGELWSGYRNASRTINESSSCKWGALPGDRVEIEDQYLYIGDNANHTNDIPGDRNNGLFKGNIDWFSWKPVADYSGVDDPPR